MRFGGRAVLTRAKIFERLDGSLVGALKARFIANNQRQRLAVIGDGPERTALTDTFIGVAVGLRELLELVVHFGVHDGGFGDPGSLHAPPGEGDFRYEAMLERGCGLELLDTVG